MLSTSYLNALLRIILGRGHQSPFPPVGKACRLSREPLGEGLHSEEKQASRQDCRMVQGERCGRSHHPNFSML